MKTSFFQCIAIVGVACGLSLSAHGEDGAQTTSDLQGNECNISSNTPGEACIPAASGAITQTSQYPGMDVADDTCQSTSGCYDAVRSDPSTTQTSIPIDVWGTCRYIDINSSVSGAESIFIPFRSAAEWDAFISVLDGNDLTSSISGTRCSKASSSSNWIIPGNYAYRFYGVTVCSDASIPMPQFYARWPDQPAAYVWPSQASVSCNNGMTAMNVQVNWYGVDSELPRISPINWDADVEYGPYLSLTASAGAESGSSITVPAGTPVTLQWQGSLSMYSSGAIPNSPADIQPMSEAPIGQPAVDTVHMATTYVQSISWGVNAGAASPVPPAEAGLTFAQQANPSLHTPYPVVTPVATTTYTLTAVGANGVTSQASVTVNISP